MCRPPRFQKLPVLRRIRPPALSLLRDYLHRAFPRSVWSLDERKRTTRQRKEGDIGPSPQLRTNEQNARRLAINMTSARAGRASQEPLYARLQGSIRPDA